MRRGVRVVLLTAGVVVAVWLLFTIVFPWVDRTLVDDPVLGVMAAGR